MDNPFRDTYRPLLTSEQSSIRVIKGLSLDLLTEINCAAPDGREKALAMTKLEEAVMWATKAITK